MGKLRYFVKFINFKSLITVMCKFREVMCGVVVVFMGKNMKICHLIHHTRGLAHETPETSQ